MKFEPVYRWSRSLFLLSLGLIFLSSCRPALYAPNEAYMMGVSNKGDLKVAGSILGGTVNSGLFEENQKKVRQYSAQFAYSPINRFALAGSYYKLKGKEIESPAIWDAENVEIALGYYIKSGKRSSEDNSYILSDFYAGSGWGNTNSIFTSAGESRIKYQRYFLHSGIQFWWRNDIAVGFSMRYVNLDFKEANLFGPVPNEFQNGVSFIDNKKAQNLMESSFSIQGGNNYFKVFFIYTGTLFASPTPLETKLNYPSANLGLILSIDQFYKPKEKRNLW